MRWSAQLTDHRWSGQSRQRRSSRLPDNAARGQPTLFRPHPPRGAGRLGPCGLAACAAPPRCAHRGIRASPDMVFVAVGVPAAKASHRIEFVGFKIGRASILFVSMFIQPWTGDVVLAGTERCLVKPASFERRNNRVFRGLGDQNIVDFIAKALRGVADGAEGFAVFLGLPAGRVPIAADPRSHVAHSGS